MEKDYKKEGLTVHENHVAFWGGAFSNFYPCKFHVNRDLANNEIDIEFSSSEQYFMWQKAMFFEDYEIADEILKAKTPQDARSLGRKVSGFDEDEWVDAREAVMYNAVYEKFSQNEDLKQFLLSDEFKGKKFVEGSPIDGIWGVKIHYNSPNIDDETNWQGLNLLGKTLDMVREELS